MTIILPPSIPLLLLAILPSLILAISLQNPLFKPPKAPTSLPVVFWHGLGDTYNGKGLANIAAIINETYPGTFIHSVYLDEDPSKDRNAGFIGHVADQVLIKGRRGTNDRLTWCVISCAIFLSYVLGLMLWDLVRADSS